MLSILRQVESRLGYQFIEKTLLEEALTHPSFGIPHYERLEFLGDAVLGFCVARDLYEKFSTWTEGELSLAKSRIVSNEKLAIIGRELGLHDAIRLDNGARSQGIETNESTLANALEAVLGAVLVDGGFQQCEKIIRKWIDLEKVNVELMEHGESARNNAVAGIEDNHFDSTSSNDGGISRHSNALKHPKNLLQEILEGSGSKSPTYTVLSGPINPQAPVWTVSCRTMLRKQRTTGSGETIKKAETQAALEMLKFFDVP